MVCIHVASQATCPPSLYAARQEDMHLDRIDRGHGFIVSPFVQHHRPSPSAAFIGAAGLFMKADFHVVRTPLDGLPKAWVRRYAVRRALPAITRSQRGATKRAG